MVATERARRGSRRKRQLRAFNILSCHHHLHYRRRRLLLHLHLRLYHLACLLPCHHHQYLDQFGVEQGPSKLADLKKLVDDGYLLSDHLIKHADCNRWVTVENAATPLVPSDISLVYSDGTTQLVSPPEAPGNLLDEAREEASALASSADNEQMEEASEEPKEDLYIDNRVGALMYGSVLVEGHELEILGGKNPFFTF